ncbi:FAD-dependent monooxygenase [Agromyces sp. Marseille-P2726]|uniref:FAD-dependent monooxygenase n=1 Tax=Agromyces sp. Marseille-P2726 TaxID=2709132 RepID=UPI00156F4876|nr:FAD-dependent monooxygenase [Agromyces sp. Marseille-P2726]
MAEASATRRELTTDVLVVGAGPSGLMLAVCLAKLGVDAIIVDGKLGPTRESRALGVQARSMELYDQLGLVDRVLAERAPAPAIVPGAGRRAFGRVEFRGLGAGVSPYTEITVFEQSRNERLLVDALADLGREVHWGHGLERLEVVEAAGGAAASVIATLARPGGETVVRARYCVGADGSHSPVRESLGIPFEGVTNAFTYYIADAADVTGLVDGAINLRFTTDHFVLAFPMGGTRMRLLGIVHDADLDAEGNLPEANVRALIRREFGVAYSQTSWFTTYRVHHRLAARFRQGPCFIVGDAAHIHSPVGAQGMNAGLQEAHNLACALADVLLGGMPDARLDRYEAERRPVGRTLVSTTDRLFANITSESRFARFVRGRALPVVGPIGVRLLPHLLGGRLYGYVSQTRIHYRMSPRLSSRRDPVVGRRLPWTGDNFDVLRSMTWQVHGYGVHEPEVQAIAESVGLAGHAFPPDPFGRLDPGLVYLVRRDGFVAAAASARAVSGGPLAFREQLAG